MAICFSAGFSYSVLMWPRFAVCYIFSRFAAPYEIHSYSVYIAWESFPGLLQLLTSSFKDSKSNSAWHELYFFLTIWKSWEWVLYTSQKHYRSRYFHGVSPLLYKGSVIANRNFSFSRKCPNRCTLYCTNSLLINDNSAQCSAWAFLLPDAGVLKKLSFAGLAKLSRLR